MKIRILSVSYLIVLAAGVGAANMYSQSPQSSSSIAEAPRQAAMLSGYADQPGCESVRTDANGSGPDTRRTDLIYSARFDTTHVYPAGEQSSVGLLPMIRGRT